MEPNENERDSTTVLLKINEWLWSDKISIPTVNATHEYRIALKTALTLREMNSCQPLMKDLRTTPVLIFTNRGQQKEGVPILELMGAENF